MRSEPKLPTRLVNKQTVYLDTYEPVTIQALLDKATELSIGADQLTLNHESDYDSCNLELFYYVPETEERFQARMDKYQADLKDYHLWLKDNKEDIKLYLDKKREVEEAKKKKDLEDKKKKLSKDSLALQNEIVRLEKELKDLNEC